MIHPTNSDKTQLDALISHGMSYRQTNNNLSESYKEQRQSFLLKRLQLQAQIILIAGLTLITFFLWVNSQLEGKIYAFKIGLVVELFTLLCWGLCKTPIGRRYPDLIFLSLCWSVTCAVQIDIALLFNNLEPRSHIWTLMFLTQATIIPVQWWMHLISQIGTILCYLTLYILYSPILKNPSAFYIEQGLYFFWTCIICVFSVYLYERLRKKEFYARKAMELAQHKSERLLLNILPEMIAEQLKHKQAEAALRQREDELRLITNAVPAKISYVDSQQRYRFNNKEYEDWFGLPASEISGKHIREILGESVYQSILPYVEAVLSGEQVTYETQLPNKDGTNHYVNVTYIPQFSQEGKVAGFVALITDITLHKLAEAALKQSEKRLKTLTEKVRVIPWEVNATTGNFTYVGPQTVEILGYPLSDWYTDNFWAKNMHPEDRKWAIQYCQESSLSLNNYEFEYRMLAADGRVVWLYDIVNVVRDENGPQLLHGFMIDISDRKQAEQEREELLKREQAARADAETANRMKDEFLATLSHELRTPLNAILGWTQLLRTRKFDQATTGRALETIERNTRSLTQLIEDVLDVSRIIRGTLHLSTDRVELVPLVEAAIDTVYPAAQAKEIIIKCRFDSKVEVVVGDANRLQQVVWNLLSNAVKFTPKGGRVDVQLECIESCVQIRVSDTGAGIAAEFLPHVFERFRQADSSSTRSHGGLGLGLAIVRHLVELHGGTVSAESPGIGQGATFVVSLPMKDL
ncbi:sensor histidine kinase [Nostoc sp.]|uniref:sensor histidine kinase n=1 Tax=Nostoc sp. TaxID=1180 RepID=UPI002FF5BEA2